MSGERDVLSVAFRRPNLGAQDPVVVRVGEIDLLGGGPQIVVESDGVEDEVIREIHKLGVRFETKTYFCG